MPDDYECPEGFEVEMARELSMVLDAIDRGEDPLGHSHWTVAVPPEVERDGPGWKVE